MGLKRDCTVDDGLVDWKASPVASTFVSLFAVHRSPEGQAWSVRETLTIDSILLHFKDISTHVCVQADALSNSYIGICISM